MSPHRLGSKPASSRTTLPDGSPLKWPWRPTGRGRVDRSLLLERSERRAWWVAIFRHAAIALIGSAAAIFVQGPLRQVVGDADRRRSNVTGEDDRSSSGSVPRRSPRMEALDKHNVAVFVRAREGYSWMVAAAGF